MAKHNYKPELVQARTIADKENAFLKVYFFENKAKNRPWNKGEIDDLENRLKTHNLVEGVCIGCAFSDRLDGFTKLFYVNEEKPFLINGYSILDNFFLKEMTNYKDTDVVSVVDRTFPEITCAAETAVLAFEQTLLAIAGGDLERYKKEFANTYITKDKIELLDFTKPLFVEPIN